MTDYNRAVLRQKVAERIFNYIAPWDRQHDGTIREVYTDHLIVAFPEVNDHCWFEEGFNLETLFNR